MSRAALRGAICCMVLVLPMAAVVGLVYRFPVPFVGYASGVGAFVVAPVGVVFYEMIGGWGLLFGAGAVAGLVSHFVVPADDARQRNLTLVLASIPALASVIVMSILDKLIGSW